MIICRNHLEDFPRSAISEHELEDFGRNCDSEISFRVHFKKYQSGACRGTRNVIVEVVSSLFVLSRALETFFFYAINGLRVINLGSEPVALATLVLYT